MDYSLLVAIEEKGQDREPTSKNIATVSSFENHKSN